MGYFLTALSYSSRHNFSGKMLSPPYKTLFNVLVCSHTDVLIFNVLVMVLLYLAVYEKLVPARFEIYI